MFFTGSRTQAQTQRSLALGRLIGTNPKSALIKSSNTFECPEEFGYYPHPTDCSQYYVCVFGGALLESCTGGLMYSHELQTCDWPRNVGCEIHESYTKSTTDVTSGVTAGYQIPAHKFRFSSLQNPTTKQTQSSSVVPILSQFPQQTIPPPPELKVPPNPVITSRGQPQQQIEQQIDIAKVIC